MAAMRGVAKTGCESKMCLTPRPAHAQGPRAPTPRSSHDWQLQHPLFALTVCEVGVRGGRGGHRVPIRLKKPTQAKKVSNYPLSCTCLLCRPLGATRGPCSREADSIGRMCDKGPGFTLGSQHPLTGRGPASLCLPPSPSCPSALVPVSVLWTP